MVAEGVPLLALPSGSILQFLLMTTPLLCVYLYFLYLAIDRPNIANPNDARYTEDRIRLMDILYTYLATLVLFTSLVVYLLWFVSKRRKLSKRYEREAIVILGNVEYNESYYAHVNAEGGGGVKTWCTTFWGWLANGFTLRNNYGRVVYDLERVANHPACDYEERKHKQLTGTITKKVRVYYRYPREQVSILVLPDHPYSGQPKIDMEADWAAFQSDVGLPSGEEDDDDRVALPQVLSRDRSLGVLLVSSFWVCFLFFASLYVVTQVGVVEDYYVDESAKTAWIVFWSVLGGAVPVISFGGNYMRWKMYERWILNSGKKGKGKKSFWRGKKSPTKGRGKSVDGDHMEEGSYVQMT